MSREHYTPYDSLEYKIPEHDPPVWERCRNVFSPRQKEAIRARDNHSCQFPEHLNGHKHECGGKKEIHHILPQGYCNELGIDPDFAENGLLICKNAHEKVHPDTAKARKGWKPKSDSFFKVQEHRRESLAKRSIYWDDTWDRQMHAMAVKNTQKAKTEGWKFPGDEDWSDPRINRETGEIKPSEVIVYQAVAETGD